MPRVPAFFADLAEARFATPVRVTAAETIARNLRRVSFQSDAIARRHAGGKLPPAIYKVEFRTARNDMRHYSPCAWRGEAGAFDVIFHQHGAGPGRIWADALKPGADLRMMGPGSGVAVDDNASRHIVIGDETSLGVARSVFDCVTDKSRAGGVIVAGDENAAKAAGLPFATLNAAPPNRAQAMLDWLAKAEPTAGARYYVSGGQDIVATVGAHLLKQRGVPRRDLYAKVHWAEGKVGL